MDLGGPSERRTLPTQQCRRLKVLRLSSALSSLSLWQRQPCTTPATAKLWRNHSTPVVPRHIWKHSRSCNWLLAEMLVAICQQSAQAGDRSSAFTNSNGPKMLSTLSSTSGRDIMLPQHTPLASLKTDTQKRKQGYFCSFKFLKEAAMEMNTCADTH